MRDRAEMDRDDAQAARYDAAFPSWKRVRPNYRCPRIVAGLRCRVSYGDLCVCQKYGGTGPLDHAIVWKAPNGERVLTGEPYQVGGEEIVAFVSDCAALGLRVQLSGGSLHCPGTLLLVVRQK